MSGGIGAAVIVGGGLVIVSWFAILPVGVVLWLRLTVQLGVIAGGVASAAAIGDVSWYDISYAFALGLWIPALVWSAQVSDDQAFRTETRAREMWPDASKTRFDTRAPFGAIYRLQMMRVATSRNRLLASARIGRSWPAWLRTQPLPNPPEIGGADTTARIRELFAAHGYLGRISTCAGTVDDGRVFLVPEESYDRVKKRRRLERELSVLVGEPSRLLTLTEHWERPSHRLVEVGS